MSLDFEPLTQTNLIIMVFVLGMLPFILTIVTSYCKIIVVISLVRNALGVQQVPPSQVLSGLAMMLTMFVMTPVGKQMVDIYEKAPAVEDADLEATINFIGDVCTPLKDFMKSNSEPRITKAFIKAAGKIWPQEIRESFSDDSIVFVIPSFVISEITKAFQIGFLLYLPFIAIDLIISNILLAMGMMMVSPMSISLPFKLMLFVSLDGWLKLAQGLMYSYG